MTKKRQQKRYLNSFIYKNKIELTKKIFLKKSKRFRLLFLRISTYIDSFDS